MLRTKGKTQTKTPPGFVLRAATGSPIEQSSSPAKGEGIKGLKAKKSLFGAIFLPFTCIYQKKVVPLRRKG